MKKWKSYFCSRVLTAACFLLPCVVKATDICYMTTPDTYSSNFGRYEVFAELIYWKCCLDNLDFCQESQLPLQDGTPGATRQEIKYHCLCPDSQPGFRVGLALNDILCDWRLSGSYTSLNLNETKNHIREGDHILISPFQLASFQYDKFNEGKGKLCLNYGQWDVLLSRAVCHSECYVVAPFVGFEGLLLEQKLKTSFSFPDNSTTVFSKSKWSSNFSAWGLKFGTDYTYRISDCLLWFSRGCFSIGCGNNDGVNKHFLIFKPEEGEPDKQEIVVKDDDCCLFINGYHIQLGVIFEQEVCGLDMGFRIGYEFVKWVNIPSQRRYVQNSEGGDLYTKAIASNAKSTLGFHGWLFGLSLAF